MEILGKMLVAKRVQVEPLSDVKVIEIQQRWLSKYLGKNISSNILQFFWQAFANNSVPHVAGDIARNAYRAASSLEFQVISAYTGGPGYMCSSTQMPSLEGKNVDAIVLPLDLSWTMLFNHEGYGPYFTKHDWILSGMVESGP